MKLAILGTRGIPARYGGFETFADELSTRLVKRGIDVTVYCIAEGSDQPRQYKGVSLVFLPSPSMGPLTTVLFDLRSLWHARKSYDVVYMLGYGAAFFCFLPKLWGAKVWINVDGIEWARAKWNFVAKTYFKLMEYCSVKIADVVVADAVGIKEFLYKRHKAIVPCEVIPYGAPIVELPKEACDLSSWSVEYRKYYLIVCRLEPENHVFEIIKGFAASKAKYPLLVVGNDQAETVYVRSLKTVSDSRIRFVGTVYDQEKLKALRCGSRAYFHGHSVGGTNPSLLEALGCGNLVVAHDNVFNREVAENAGTYFTTANDLSAIIQKIELMSDDECVAVARLAKDRIRAHYTWDKIAEQYAALIEKPSK